MTMPCVPKDRTKREHYATVRSVKYSAPDGGFVILELGDRLTACGPFAAKDFGPGITYRFMGRWESHDKFGDQFKFTSFVADRPISMAAIVAYLTKTCDGIGEKVAHKLWQRYGETAIETLRLRWEEVADAGILSAAVASEASQQLRDEEALERTKVELHDILQGRGFGQRTANAALSKWGAKAPAIIRRDPFRLLGMPGAGFKRCDKLWRDLGLKLDRLKRQVYAALQEIRNDRDGNTWFSTDRVSEIIKDAIGETAKPAKAMRLAIKCGLMSIRKDGDGKLWLANRNAQLNEQAIAREIVRLSKWPTNLWPRDLPTSTGDGDGLPSAHQVEELLKATSSPVGCFVGGPGAGKSFSLAFVIRSILAAHGEDKVAVVAPTGKASVRATQALRSLGIDLRATTIHQLLEIGRNGHDGDGWGFLRDADNPLDQRFLIIDETSMVDVPLMARLLEACADGTHVLFIGDTYQLPPVGHGAPLRDIIAAGIPTGELTEIRRNAGQIVRTCKAIKESSVAEFSTRIDLDAGDNLRFVECANDSIISTICKMLEVGIKGFDSVWQTQVICATNDRGDCSRKSINARLQPLLNPEGQMLLRGKTPFAPGDKIICLRNGNLNEWEEVFACKGHYHEAYPKREIYVANGEIGRVLASEPTYSIARFGEAIVRVPIVAGTDSDTGEKTEGDGSSFDLAYAVTCHKCQGSQSKVVIIVADPAGGVSERHWWYTAISRAEKLCVVVGEKETFERQISKAALARRKTFLAEEIIVAFVLASGGGAA
jgi:exodeoxyribonuclease V alpha subunit